MGRKRRVEFSEVNADGRAVASAFMEELRKLREGAATHLRYMDAVFAALDRGDVEVARNVLTHQCRNLRWAIEASGPLTPGGYAGAQMTVEIDDVIVPKRRSGSRAR